ncbi:hypothetical protein ACPOL_3063 [Acidisarcina polymorpha]|uniref:Uncharacterized protein n=1 Tax=Acidisarcina polymorpha TaxID=2211140 RepID=A0A2Z5G038_9BACT|nr:hypothetical protein ACPOL_3063 [Acidisarcina polymorpha]
MFSPEQGVSFGFQLRILSENVRGNVNGVLAVSRYIKILLRLFAEEMR